MIFATTHNTVRAAVVNSPEAAVAPYLPGNYEIVWSDEETTIIVGRDVAGWTLDDYVIPRLASGLRVAVELLPATD